ncbi:hypothetical protein [Serinibacter salmoneus]|uniref:Uncharacterized protein n=1 Tax=Serinibacter salmoneus TaxID=556530 RepID=A0A2A9CXJ4_9MICO|nr:hypothetical protein [Serinibacter salmoneus]PFG19158.1 hypothetical protein ATL40_0715 [Serinibacter salmoneus]
MSGGTGGSTGGTGGTGGAKNPRGPLTVEITGQRLLRVGWLWALIVAAGLGAALVIPTLWQLTVAAALSVALVLFLPRGQAVGWWLAVIAFAVVAGEPLGQPRLAALLLCVHTVILASGLIVNLHPRDGVSFGVLRPRLRLAAAVQLLAQALGLAGWAVSATVAPSPDGAQSPMIWLAVVAAVALTALAIPLLAETRGAATGWTRFARARVEMRDPAASRHLRDRRRQAPATRAPLDG